jgi:hypothetical protein
MLWLETVILIVLIAGFVQLRRELMATQQELVAQLNTVRDQFTKAKDEIVAKIQALQDAINNAGGTTPEVDAAVAELVSLAQALDDIVPDVQS